MKIIYLIVIACLIVFVQCKLENNLLIVHYHRYNSDYDGWTLWSWLDDVNREIKSAGKDDFGLIFELNLSKYPPAGNINLLPKFKDWQSKDDPHRLWDRKRKREI